MSDKLNLNVSVSEPSGKAVEDREAAVRESGVGEAVAQALYRERLLRTSLDGLERREKALMARIEELEFKNEQLRADCNFFERSRLEYKFRYEKACEAHGDMVDRYHDLLRRTSEAKNAELRHLAEMQRQRAAVEHAAKLDARRAATGDFDPPCGGIPMVGGLLGLRRGCGCTNGCAAWGCKNL